MMTLDLHPVGGFSVRSRVFEPSPTNSPPFCTLDFEDGDGGRVTIFGGADDIDRFRLAAAVLNGEPYAPALVSVLNADGDAVGLESAVPQAAE